MHATTRRAGTIFLLFGLFGTSAVHGQNNTSGAKVEGPGAANYTLAARFAPYKLDKLIYSTAVDPHWIEGTDRFWYEWKSSSGSTFYIVDPLARSKRPLFDNDRMAAELTRITHDPWDGQHLPIRAIRFIDANTIQFEVESSQDEEQKSDTLKQQERGRSGGGRARARKKVHHFEYDLTTQTLRELSDYEAPDNQAPWASVSPDGNTIVYARNNDLYMMTGAEYEKILDARRGKQGQPPGFGRDPKDTEADSAEWKVEVVETQLTTDGEKDYSYAVDDFNMIDSEKEKHKDKRKRARITWAPDSRHFAVLREDNRKVGDLWVIHNTGSKRPELETYKYEMPGEENVPQGEIWIYDLAGRNKVKVRYANPWKDELFSFASARQFNYPDSEEPRRSLWLSTNPDEFHFIRSSRDRHRVDLMVANANTGEAHPLVEERMNTYVETRNPERLSNGDLLWWSERTGWAHIYRYSADGKLKNAVTSGAYAVQDMEGVDENSGHVFIQAAGREIGEDPYYEHLYRARLDGAGVQLVAPGDFDHRAELPESNRYFVDNYSRVNTVPRAVVRDAAGRLLMPLDSADFSQLFAAGWQMPEPFSVKAADGVTDLYGVMYKPFDFDSTRIYPVVEYVYPGPQTESVAKSFSTSRYETALAQFGFVVLTVGNRGGNPSRSKWYHNYGYGNLRDYGLADKKVTVEQLAARHPWIDIDRVGIYGHSGGGFMSTAAMLVYPDFFKVAVSSSGNHTNDIYNRNWSETHHGVKEVVGDSGKVSFEYSIDRNPDLARNLKGHLLLTTGGIDSNVHPANTIRMADALIKANKRFDFFIMPGARHPYTAMADYWFWLRAEYFVRNLMGDPRWNADITQLQVEKEQKR